MTLLAGISGHATPRARPLFVVATDFERRSVHRGIRAATRHDEDCPARVLCAGVRASRMDIPEVGDNRTACTISGGFAAGLCPHIATGTVLLPEQVVSEDGREFRVHSALHRELHAALTHDLDVDTRPLLQVDRILSSSNEKLALGADGRFAAADMESAILAERCAQRRIPYVVLRVVADRACDPVPPALRAVYADNADPSVPALLAAVAVRPSNWLQFGKLVRSSLYAGRVLADAVARSAPAWQLSPTTLATTRAGVN